MRSRNRYISNPYLRLIISSYPDRQTFLSLNQVKTSLFILSFCQRFQHQIRSIFRFIYFHHLILFISDFYDSRKGVLAQLAFEFCEIIRINVISNLFFYFARNPLSEASQVNLSAAALAKTWRDEWVVFSLLIAAADLAVHFALAEVLHVQLAGLDFEDAVALVVEVGFPDPLDLVVGLDLQHDVLDSAELDDGAGLESVALRGVVLDGVLPVDFVEAVRVVLLLLHLRLQLEDPLVLSFVNYD